MRQIWENTLNQSHNQGSLNLRSFSSHFPLWSVTKFGNCSTYCTWVAHFIHNSISIIVIWWHLLWIFDLKSGIWNLSTSNVAESSILWASLQILNIFWIVFQHNFEILPNYLNSREKTMKFDAPYLVSNIYEARVKMDLTYLERIPNAFSVWRLWHKSHSPRM